MTYPEVIQYLESFINYEKIPAYPYKESCKLERIKDFLSLINNPQSSLKAIHVAGSKGKGSTCAFITYILRQADHNVGLYTSPHLNDFRERIRILKPNTSRQNSHCEEPQAVARNEATKQTRSRDSSLCSEQAAQSKKRDCSARLGLAMTAGFEGMIPEYKLTALVERLKSTIDKYNIDSKYGPLSFFEVYTALAFVYFKEENVDFAVLETGLGGRLDATNAVNALICAITPISYEHTQKLGNTLKEIAAEKAGIIKGHQVSAQASPKGTRSPSSQIVVISAPQEEEAIEVIRQKCKEEGAKLYEVGKDILFEKSKERFNLRGLFEEYKNLEINLLGDHQLINAAVAVGAVEALRSYNVTVGINSIRQGLYNTIWPGRCEVISRNPFIVLDGAQNAASAKALKETIKERFSAKGGSACGGKYRRLILVLGISKDKDIKGICGQLNELADEVILTKADNPRAAEPEILSKYFDNKKISITNSIEEAKIKARELAKKEDLVLVTGSLFVVGEFRNDEV